jgi:hypothetical protein
MVIMAEATSTKVQLSTSTSSFFRSFFSLLSSLSRYSIIILFIP